MKALISPNEKVIDYENNIGERVAQVQQIPFAVAQPFFWVDCPDECDAGQWWYYGGICQPIPQPPMPPET